MMVVGTVRTADVQGDPGRLRKALQPVRDHLRAQLANLLALEAQVDHRVRPVRQVDDRPRQRLVQRRVAAAEPCQRCACA